MSHGSGRALGGRWAIIEVFLLLGVVQAPEAVAPNSIAFAAQFSGAR